jgi:hypothetical protein
MSKKPREQTTRTPQRAPAKKAESRAAGLVARIGGWQESFLAMLRDTANVRRSAEAAAVARSTAYAERETDAEFARRWDEALEDACDVLEAAAWKRAVEGTEKPVYQGGQLVGHVQEYSDTLTLALLKAHRPEKYRERLDARHSGPDGGAIPVLTTFDLAKLTDEELGVLERIVDGRTSDKTGA